MFQSELSEDAKSAEDEKLEHAVSREPSPVRDGLRDAGRSRFDGDRSHGRFVHP
jgi:hypothetical protein